AMGSRTGPPARRSPRAGLEPLRPDSRGPARLGRAAELRLASGRREQLAGVAARRLVVPLTAQHAHDLADQLVAVDPLNGRLPALAGRVLDDPKVRVGH